MMKPLFNLEIRAFDIFLAKRQEDKHYFVCIYSQADDRNTKLKNDFYGLLVTTNKKYKRIINNYNDYNVSIKINETECYVCCDKLTRFYPTNDITVINKKLTSKERYEIKKKFNRFIQEINEQMEVRI